MEDYYKEEVECTHMYLDDLGVSRGTEENPFSLVGRIKQLEKRMIVWASEMENSYLKLLSEKE